MFSGPAYVARDRILAHAQQPAGRARSAPFPDVLQKRNRLLVRQPRLFQNRSLALRKMGFAGVAEEHANAFALAAPTLETEISLAADAVIGTG